MEYSAHKEGPIAILAGQTFRENLNAAGITQGTVGPGGSGETFCSFLALADLWTPFHIWTERTLGLSRLPSVPPVGPGGLGRKAVGGLGCQKWAKETPWGQEPALRGKTSWLVCLGSSLFMFLKDHTKRLLIVLECTKGKSRFWPENVYQKKTNMEHGLQRAIIFSISHPT